MTDPKAMSSEELIAEARTARPGDVLASMLQLVPLIQELAARLESARSAMRRASDLLPDVTNEEASTLEMEIEAAGYLRWELEK